MLQLPLAMLLHHMSSIPWQHAYPDYCPLANGSCLAADDGYVLAAVIGAGARYCRFDRQAEPALAVASVLSLQTQARNMRCSLHRRCASARSNAQLFHQAVVWHVILSHLEVMKRRQPLK